MITSSTPKSKTSPEFQRLLLLHNTAQGIHSELLELNECNARPLPTEIKEMTDFVIKRVYSLGKSTQQWTKKVDFDKEYQSLVDSIIKVDAIMNANNDRVEHEIDIRVPIYGHRMLKNLTLDSFILEIQYATQSLWQFLFLLL